MYIAHISDTHFIKDKPSTVENARRIIDAINSFATKPEFVVVTGDLVNTPNYEDYELCFSELNRLVMPYYVVGGNHDKASMLKEALGKCYPKHPTSEVDGYLQYCVDIGDLKVVAVDFYGDKQDEHRTDKYRLDWLKNKLQETPENKKVLLIMHKYPLKSNLKYFEKDENAWMEEFVEIVSSYKNKVKLVACGHLHNSLMGTISGVPVVSTLSPYGLLNMDFQGRDNLVQEDRDFLAFHVHHFAKENLTSYLVNIDMVKR